MPPSNGYSTLNLALIGQAGFKKRMILNDGHIYVNSPVNGQTIP